MATLLEQYGNANTRGDKCTVVRNGHQPEREILAHVAAEDPRVRGHLCSRSTLNSNKLPRYVRVTIGFTPGGKKQRVAIADGYRESQESFVEV
ncbi:hypothetical protein [Paraburkholderia sp. BL6665CI2N2]|uniref:hypothetical protein n=1 Tax=Paraburkholderia sp. BL6665CI2N2 TaxID=1938806 RepID=UPI00106689AD|nr:hypothetical protein [Paraburkholderia sp. BL6665CI2N2]